MVHARFTIVGVILGFFLCPSHLPAQNVAQGKPVTAVGGALWSGFPVTNLVDGNTATFTHPVAGVPGSDSATPFYYQIDLGQEYTLHHLTIYNRSDGCCPERLTNYKLALYANNGGAVGALNWEAVIRSNGTNSGVGGADIVYPNASTNPAHQFKGRFLRLIKNTPTATNYNPQVGEIQAWLESPNINLCLGRPTIASGATWSGLPAPKITDGNRTQNSISHPAAGATLGFYFQVDMGAEHHLSRVVVYNRDNCCPERLTNYKVTLYADNAGAPGAVLWEANVRTDGTNSGLGGADTVLASTSTNPAHVFRGRFLRITNLSGAEYNPQIAELEAYPQTPAKVNYFLTNVGNLSPTGQNGLPTSATLTWNVEAGSTVTIDQGIGSVAATGSVVVSPTATTVYTLTATRPGAANATATVKIGVNAVAQPAVINEIQASNGLLEDEDGDREDWIELRNPNDFTLSLLDYYLTDKFAAKTQWRFPLVNIPPNGFLVVFASAKNRAPVGGQLHTNFRLNGNGEYVGLIAPNGTTVERQIPADYPTTLTYPPQTDQVSYGLDASNTWGYFSPPSPGTGNGTAFVGVVADTNFSVKRGFYTTPQTVAITTTTPGAEIRYTLGSAAPTPTTGTVYTGPLTISSTTVLRAAAFKAGHIPTNVDTNTYIFPADVITSSVMSTSITQHATYGPQMNAALRDLITISLVTPATISQDNPVGCSFEIINSDNTPGTQENAGVELYGGEFTNFQKKNFRVSFTSEFGATKLTYPSLFANHARGWKPATRFDQLELRGGSHDMAMRGFYMSNSFTDAAMLDMGGIAPHSRFVHLYMNGTYWGVYQLRERWNAQMLAQYFGGPTEEYESINGNYNVGGWADPGDVYDGDGSAWARIKTLRSNYPELRKYVDLRQFVDYMVLWMFGHAEDEYRTTGLKDIGSGFKFFLNDADGWLSLDTSAWDGNANNTIRLGTIPGRRAGDGPASLLSALWTAGHPDFLTLLADRIHKALFNNGALSPSQNAARLTALCAEMERPFYAESARWVSSGQSRTPDTWLTARNNILNNWFPQSFRPNTYLSQLRTAGYYPTFDAPAFSGGTVASGTVVNFPVAGSTVYFTTDGSDPRLPGGAVNPAATLGTTTTITKNTLLRARSRQGSNWSALNEALYVVTAPLSPGDVVLSEIHYNAQGDDDTEFVEILNITDKAVNLRGAKFTSGIDFTFPDNRDTFVAPGQRIVIVKSEYSFQKRYGINIPIAGFYADSLGNDGERLIFQTAGNATLADINYGDAAPWPDSADGDGYSMILVDVSNPSSPNSYRSSTGLHGTPGTSDAIAPFGGNALADADNDGLVALVEHFLATDDNSGASGLPVLRSGQLPGGYLSLTFTRRLGADDLRYTVKSSTDLSTWSADALRSSHINHGNGTATEVWIVPDTDPRRYMRLEVTRP